MAGNNLQDLRQKLDQLRRQWASWLCVTVRQDQLHYRQLQAQGWQTLNPAELPALTLFSKVILLIPARHCSYKQCRFPLHLVAEKELREAIELDFEKWSPWGKQSQYFFSHQLVGEEWCVNIWVWDLELATRLKAQVDRCTHIIPELAWIAACTSGNPSLLIVAENQCCHYLLVNAAGWAEKLAQVQNKQQAERYWHGWGMPPINRCWINELTGDQWYPDDCQPELIPQTAVAHHKLLTLTRLSGVQDWTDPMSYRQFMGVAAVACLLWMTADAAVIQYQQSQIDLQLQSIRSSANDAITLRQQVKDRQQLFQQIQGLRYKQQLPEYLIAELSQKIPKDIWLDIVQLQEDQLDIAGRGKQVVRLLPLLEQIKGIEQVLLLNDVHPDPVSGEEIFQIRLVLAPHL